MDLKNVDGALRLARAVRPLFGAMTPLKQGRKAHTFIEAINHLISLAQPSQFSATSMAAVLAAAMEVAEEEGTGHIPNLYKECWRAVKDRAHIEQAFEGLS